jgi:pyroglutamyl-peptidase
MNKTKRILLYGFGPYRPFRENITKKILKSLPKQPGLKKVVFPVRFRRAQFVEALSKFRPDVILGLGQSSRRRIEVESRALNWRRARRSKKRKRILRYGPASIGTTLRLKVGKGARRSMSAGDYVCNFSMYVMLDYIQRQELSIPFGFVHIPHDQDVGKARRCVEELLRRCRYAA